MPEQTFAISGGSHSTVGGSPFPAVADYGFISDCEVSALVAPSGSVEWMCLPRMDGPSIFAAILDRHAGWFRVGPADVTVPAERHYLPGTMVLETTWDTPTGWAVVRDVLLIGPWRRDRPASSTYRRAPTDHQPERVLLRTVRCLSGWIDLVVECEPASTMVADAASGATRARRSDRPRSDRVTASRRSG
jgi:alpha,alpha-trehalase